MELHHSPEHTMNIHEVMTLFPSQFWHFKDDALAFARDTLLVWKTKEYNKNTLQNIVSL